MAQIFRTDLYLYPVCRPCGTKYHGLIKVESLYPAKVDARSKFPEFRHHLLADEGWQVPLGWAGLANSTKYIHPANASKVQLTFP